MRKPLVTVMRSTRSEHEACNCYGEQVSRPIRPRACHGGKPMASMKGLLAFAGLMLPTAIWASSPTAVVIDSASIDLVANTVTLSGLNFGSVPPTLKLAGTQLVVQSYNSRTGVAT